MANSSYNCNCPDIEIEVQPPETFTVEIAETVYAPVVEVEVPGIQGPSMNDSPLDIDPLEIYLKARGEISNG